MNEIKTTIKQIENVDSIHIVTFDYKGIDIKMMSLDLQANLSIGQKVEIVVKPTHISIAKDFSGLTSQSNQIKTKIEKLDIGKLVAVVTLNLEDTLLESIITSNSTKSMDLKIGDEVTIFIKSSDISILGVCDDWNPK